MNANDTTSIRSRVVVVGGGFGGLRAVRALRRASVDVVLIDRANHHSFQPLFYQVATCGLSPGLVAPPLRWILRRQRNASVVMAEVERIDVQAREVHALGADGHPLVETFDYLVVAAGARHGYFGNDDWEQAAPGLKTVTDALEIRRRILYALECAELATDDAERRRHGTFVVVGAGPTGVEIAGQIVEMARRTVRGEFRSFDASTCRVVLVDAADRVLAGFAPSLSRSAARQLNSLGVELVLGAPVTGVDADGVTCGERRIDGATVLWAAGVSASPLAAHLARQVGASVDGAGRIDVDDHLHAGGSARVFAIGDMAATGLPGVAPVAMQQGRYVAREIGRMIRGTPVGQPFRYSNKGSMATIGRNRAVAEIGRIHLSGFLAWMAWLLVHLAYLVGFSNRIFVLLRWSIAYFSAGRGERALTGGERRWRGHA